MVNLFNKKGLRLFRNCEMDKMKVAKTAKWHQKNDMLLQGSCGDRIAIAIGDTKRPKSSSIGCMMGRVRNAPQIVSMIEELALLIEYLYEAHQTNETATDFHVWVWRNMPDRVDSEWIFRKFMAKMLISPKCGIFGVSAESDRHAKKVSNLYLNQYATKEDFMKARRFINDDYKDNHAECNNFKLAVAYDCAVYAAEAAYHYGNPENAVHTALAIPLANSRTTTNAIIALFKEGLKSFK